MKQLFLVLVIGSMIGFGVNFGINRMQSDGHFQVLFIESKTGLELQLKNPQEREVEVTIHAEVGEIVEKPALHATKKIAKSGAVVDLESLMGPLPEGKYQVIVEQNGHKRQYEWKNYENELEFRKKIEGHLKQIAVDYQEDKEEIVRAIQMAELGDWNQVTTREFDKTKSDLVFFDQWMSLKTLATQKDQRSPAGQSAQVPTALQKLHAEVKQFHVFK